jgi:hypothetical protein
MKALLFPIILSISAFGGVFAADFLRGGAPAPTHTADEAHGEAAKDSHGKPVKDGHGKTASHGGQKDDHGKTYSVSDSDFIKFKRQFVVPVLSGESVEALVLLNLGLEVPSGKRDSLFQLEPRFRDAFIRELLQLSDDGYFSEEMTSPETYEVVRETLMRAAGQISGEDVTNVLILDFSRQDR